jgi:hypothetical protein
VCASPVATLDAGLACAPAPDEAAAEPAPDEVDGASVSTPTCSPVGVVERIDAECQAGAPALADEAPKTTENVTTKERVDGGVRVIETVVERVVEKVVERVVEVPVEVEKVVPVEKIVCLDRERDADEKGVTPTLIHDSQATSCTGLERGGCGDEASGGATDREVGALRRRVAELEGDVEDLRLDVAERDQIIAKLTEVRAAVLGQACCVLCGAAATAPALSTLA